MPSFVTRRATEPAPDSPEALFYLLRPVDPNVRHLWSHQADMLRAYQATAVDATDVAVELPTGSGKTLVGLLLAEWRRRSRRERVALLCPTRHLARQVGDRAAAYGIPAVVLVGRNDDWPQAEYLRYSRSEAIVVTTYSTVFNTNPRLDDANLLVFDDAHAGESYVASMWALVARRGEPLYAAMVDAVRPELPAALAERLADRDGAAGEWAAPELLGPHQVAPHADLLREAITAHAAGDAEYAGSVIGPAIGRCLMFVTPRELLVRPLIPPTWFHPAFADATQRIYMSATLGSGGELERAFGVASIVRLPIPAGWQEYGAGRRFFMFPGASPDLDADASIDAAIERAGRVLVITPSEHELRRFAERAPRMATVLTKDDLERDPNVVSRTERALMLLANRYDGIDLPDDSCRLIVLAGLPSGTHLQERFLYERLGAKAVLAERMRTRIVQGAGRGTRNAKDYAAVILHGPSLIDFVSRLENTRPMRPDLQAEIEFGFLNTELSEEQFAENLDSFLAQDEAWADADTEIRGRASEFHQEPQPGAAELAIAAPFEVRSWQAAWRDDLDAAIDHARDAADQLAGPAVGAYRCLWLFLAASWAKSAAAGRPTTHADALVADAEACARSMPWRPRFGRAELERQYPVEFGPRDERARAVLAELGLRGGRFEAHLARTLELLADRRASSYEEGLRRLGELLGFEAIRPEGSGAPDGAWREETKAWFVFEAKTEVDPTLAIPMRDIRQVLTHADWLAAAGWERPGSVVAALVTDQETIHPDAAAIARDTMVVAPTVIDAVAEQTMRALRAVRRVAPGMGDEQIAAALNRAYRHHNLNTDTLALRLMDRPAGRLRQVG